MVLQAGGTELVIFRDAEPVTTKPSEDQGDHLDDGGSSGAGGLKAGGFLGFVLVALALGWVLIRLQQRRTSVSNMP